MKVSFHGAAKEVTGSCHLVTAGKRRILLDCGLFQGIQGRAKNEAKFGFDPNAVDTVVLSHGHLDHVGRLPLLVKNGFRGEVISTAATQDISEIILHDSAKIQEEDARRSKGRKEPLYTERDVNDAIKCFGESISYEQTIELAPGIKLTLFDAGHILGSSFVLLEIEEGGKEKKIIFSGDLGNNNKPIIGDPKTPPSADYVLMESTYGNRSHKSIEESIEELYEAINETFERKGNFYIPVFAVERAQEFLYLLREGIENGIIPSNTKIFLDSPMAIAVTKAFMDHPECYDEDARKLVESGVNPFLPPNTRFTRTAAESKEINDVKNGAIILAGSGMTHAGRILHHMKNGLPKRENGFAFVSYTPSGTAAGKIIDGATRVRILGKDVPVRAQAYTINGFSAHAGQKELLDWHEPIEPKRTFLTHGDHVPMTTLASELKSRGNKKVEMPAKGNHFEL